MATAFNSTVIVYRRVPLVKGGTGVLYLSGTSATGALAGFAQRTYSSYYYTKENKNSIQIGAPIGDIEGCNYVAFQNASHGGHWYFGFIDHLVYINDNNTEIHFTVDPFPTFLGDTTQGKYVYIKRNTVAVDSMGKWLANDYLPKVAKNKFTPGITLLTTCKRPAIYFICNQQKGDFITADGNNTAIQIIRNATVQDVGDILAANGTILGCYLLPDTPLWNNEAMEGGSVLTANVADIGSGFRHNKIYSGVYNKVALVTTQSVKFYDLEDFDNPNAITFKQVRIKIPAPAILYYPQNYKGVPDNVAEGLTMILPSMPIATPSVYTQGQAINDIFAIAGTAISGAVMGAMGGAGVGAIPGLAVGIGMGVANMAKNVEMTRYQPQGATSCSFPNITSDYILRARLSIVSPSLDTLLSVDDYFDYYGYEIDEVFENTEVNTNDGAYLQTNSGWLSGSEGDDEINARLIAGIKIIKSFT